jgi:ATP-binding cassette subfamily F protein uup
VREEHWLRYGVTARRKRNVGRLENVWHGLRANRREQRRATGSVNMQVSAEAVGLRQRSWSRRMNDQQELWRAYRSSRDFSTTRIMRGDRIGIVGPEWRWQDDAAVKMLTGVLAAR